MKKTTNYTEMLNTQHISIVAILRIVLGVILLWRGIGFIQDTAEAQSYIEQAGITLFSDNSGLLAFVISWLGMICGFFILVGLFTKTAAIIQIPVLFVVVFFINAKQYTKDPFELILSIITLLLLLIIAVKGSGSLSADSYFKKGADVDKKPMT